MTINPDETIDDLGSYKIIQKKSGYRFTEDSVSLADFVLPLKPTDSVIDLGTGSGVIPLILAQKSQVQNIVGIEIQEGLAELAKRNVELNNLSSMIRITQGDLRDSIHNNLFKGNSFSVVISNPPYTKAASGRISPSQEKRIAKTETACSLQDMIRTSRQLISDEGRIVYSYPVSRLKEMLSVMRNNKLEPVRVKFVEPRPGCKVKIFLIEAVKKKG
ncbi:MAG: tRNA (adenine(22)-N(1))-methyltransferase TrmK [Deltaproteobacteria bacterium]|nr:tRNA (adenine(22)-N(1))-methyltransferase TrmK [Deltaproteobacteria bacterium]